jgi:hypothetical protein
VIEAGLKLNVTPLGCPLADSATGAAKPPAAVVDSASVPLEPSVIVRAAVLVDTAKLGTFTVTFTVVVCMRVPLTPVTVMGYIPAPTDEAAWMFMAELPVPAMEDGPKAMVSPAGWPDADSATAELKPPDAALLMVALPMPPALTTMAPPELSEKLGAVTVSTTVIEDVFALEVPAPLVPVKVIA